LHERGIFIQGVEVFILFPLIVTIFSNGLRNKPTSWEIISNALNLLNKIPKKGILDKNGGFFGT